MISCITAAFSKIAEKKAQRLTTAAHNNNNSDSEKLDTVDGSAKPVLQQQITYITHCNRVAINLRRFFGLLRNLQQPLK